MTVQRLLPRAFLTSLSLTALAACGTADKAPAADTPAVAASNAAGTTSVEPTVVTIVARDYAYDAPDTITAGMVTLKLVNKGPELHHVQLFRLTGGKTLADLTEGIKTMKEGDPLPPWVEVVAGPNSPVPGGEQTLTEELSAGTYVLVCLIPSPDHMPHVMKGMLRGLTVVPATGAVAAAPASDITVRMTDYAWDLPTTIPSGKHMIRVENEATQQHEMFIARLEKGKTPAELAEWALSPKGPPPGVPMGGMSGMLKGSVAYVPVDLTPGEYALLCFIPDAKDGKPHFRHGMMKAFTVN